MFNSIEDYNFVLSNLNDAVIFRKLEEDGEDCYGLIHNSIFYYVTELNITMFSIDENGKINIDEFLMFICPPKEQMKEIREKIINELISRPMVNKKE